MFTVKKDNLAKLSSSNSVYVPLYYKHFCMGFSVLCSNDKLKVAYIHLLSVQVRGSF